MVVKSILIITVLFFASLKSYSNILYKKNDLVITDIDLKIYIQLYSENYNLFINENNALKDLILIKNLLKNLEKNNKEFIAKIDNEILLEFGNNSFNVENVRDFLRFTKIRNEFIINYFKNNLNVDELKILFENNENLKLPISSKDCLIIDDVINLNDNNQFIEGFYNKLKNNTEKIFIIFNEINYQVCIDEASFKSIEGLIVGYIQDQTSEEFEKFIYDKARN